MVDADNEKYPSKRVRLSPEREADGLSPNKAPKSDQEGVYVDEEPFLTNFSVFQQSPSSSREHDGGKNEFSKHEQFESDDFPSCFSVEDDIDNTEEHHYQPIAGPMGWVQRQMNLGINPREILSYMIPHAKVPTELEDSHSTLWKIIIELLTSPSPRKKLDYVNTLDDVINLINSCKNIVVLTGAGVSVSCGIPDFRSRDGIYERLSQEYPDLPDPQAMFDITYFNQNPKPFFKFAKEIYPGQFKPSLSHRFIHQIEVHGRLLRNYSQNIDTLEQIAGITRVIQCHGFLCFPPLTRRKGKLCDDLFDDSRACRDTMSVHYSGKSGTKRLVPGSFSTASCTNCKYQVSSNVIKDDIFCQKIPICPKCSDEEGQFAIMKPDIVFFGENLPSGFYHHLEEDSEKADLLIVIGSSLKVRPVALIPSRIAEDVPQILINREPLRHMTFDVELLGDCDVIVSELCERLAGTWTSILDGREVPPVNQDLYRALMEDRSNDLSLLGSGRGEKITLEPYVENPLQDATSCAPLNVSVIKQLSQTPTDVHDLQEGPLIHKEEDTIISSLVTDSCIPVATPQTGLGDNPPQSSLVTDSTERVSVGCQPGSWASPDVPPKNICSISGANLTAQEPTLPVGSCQSVGEETGGIASGSTDDVADKQRVESSGLGDVSTSQYPNNQDSLSTNKDSQKFIHIPPSRYIFYGAELSNSPPHSPFDSPTHNDDDSVNYNSEHDSQELSLLEANGYSSGDGSEGYGSGAMSATDLSNYDLKMITGALGDYSCVSEENSVISGVELFIDENREGRLDSLAYIPPSESNIQPIVSSDNSSIAPLGESYKDNINIAGLDASNFSASHIDPTTSTESTLYTS